MCIVYLAVQEGRLAPYPQGSTAGRVKKGVTFPAGVCREACDLKSDARALGTQHQGHRTRQLHKHKGAVSCFLCFILVPLLRFRYLNAFHSCLLCTRDRPTVGLRVGLRGSCLCCAEAAMKPFGNRHASGKSLLLESDDGSVTLSESRPESRDEAAPSSSVTPPPALGAIGGASIRLQTAGPVRVHPGLPAVVWNFQTRIPLRQ